MQNYRVIVSSDAADDLKEMTRYIASLYHVESGHNYVNRILGKLASLSYTADMYRYSQFATARRIHPKAKTLSSLLAYKDVAHGMKASSIPVVNAYTTQVLYRMGFKWSPTTWDYVDQMLGAISGLGFFD